MQDASAKGSFGVYVAFKQLIDPGKWNQCNRIKGDVSQYCFLESLFNVPGTTIELPTILGICAPVNCTAEELQSFPYLEVCIRRNDFYINVNILIV